MFTRTEVSGFFTQKWVVCVVQLMASRVFCHVIPNSLKTVKLRDNKLSNLFQLAQASKFQCKYLT